MNRINTFAFATLVVFASACSNTAKGVEKDAGQATDKAAAATQDAGTKMAAATDSAGASVGGAFNTADIKTALLADTRISATDINVDSDAANKTVTLKGTVPTKAQAAIAEEITKGKAPEYHVVNKLTVKAK
jgi:hyperosmotically inducible periplasmic protein